MAEQVISGNSAGKALVPGEAAAIANDEAGFTSFADFEAQMSKEEDLSTGAAEVQNSNSVRPAEQIAPVVEDTDAASEDETTAPVADETTAPVAGEPKEKTSKGPAKTSLKDRVGQLTREKHEEATRAAQALERAEAAEERARLAEEAAQNGDAPAVRETVASDRPNAEDFEFGEYDPNYQDALVEWRVEQAVSKREAKASAEAAATEQRNVEKTRTERWGSVIEAGAQKNEDFEAKVLSGKGWELSKQMWELAVDSAVGDDVLYHLASDPAESSRIFKLPLTLQAVEFGKLESRFSQPSPDKGKSEAKNGTTKFMPSAPTPQSQMRGTSGQQKVDPSTTDFSAFEALAAAEEKARTTRR